MENQEKKKSEVLLKDVRDEGKTISLRKKPVEIDGIIKKAVLYFALGFAFIGCMFLIFGSSEDENEMSLKLNDVVPQASEAELQSDKQKAYEQELMEKRASEKKEALMALSDYWKNESTEGEESGIENQAQTPETNELKTLSSSQDKGYHAIRNTIDNFYQDENDDHLRQEVERLQKELAEKEMETQRNPMEDQLALMERSYQMAAKYLPQSVEPAKDTIALGNSSRENIRPVYTAQKNVVSSLYRESADPEFMMHWNEQRNREFNTVKPNQEVPIVKNSIRACIHETQTIILGSSAKLRLLEPVRIDRIVIPAGTLLTASVKLDGGRLGLAVNSVEWQGSIFPVDITIYDLDGQRGLYLPYSPEVSALKEFASGMGNSAGTNITLTSSAGQQLAADLTKGVVQGVSGYFSKKTKVPEITLKAGHELLLVPKE